MNPYSAFHIMTKPIGPVCNLDCKYCFYLEKARLYPGNSRWRMSDALLEDYVRQYIEAQDVPTISFAWQGGEPTLLGVSFFQRVVELQRRYADGKQVTNALQTNGTLLDDEWCAFLAGNRFLVGLSLDGPQDLHDAYRVDPRGRPTFDAVMRGLETLKRHGVEFNLLTVVNRLNSRRSLEVYRFLREVGSGFIQFIPLVERANASPETGLDLAPPPSHGQQAHHVVTEWSVEPYQYGNFLNTVFDEWVSRDVGQVFVQIFDNTLGAWLGEGSSLCVFDEACGKALAMEHNGDVYACDHYAYPEYLRGNLALTSLRQIVDAEGQRAFGEAKRDLLTRKCRECRFRFACNGDCPKHRFTTTPDGEPGQSYLCEAYESFFTHTSRPFRQMADLVAHGRPASEIMHNCARDTHTQPPAGRNVPCPCGSGLKLKRCCGK